MDRSKALITRPVSDRAVMGAVYTPDALARWVAGLVRDAASTDIRSVLDPACGDGALLAAAKAEIPIAEGIFGFDLSPLAAKSLAQRTDFKAKARATNALLVNPEDVIHIDAAIMNPPWGADVGTPRAVLRKRGYETARGQFDSWGLFVEWSVRSLRRGAVVGAILPDAFFLPEHTAVRRLLLQNTQLHTVARLGEGWFPGVFRGVAVIVYVVGGGTKSHVNCLRITHDARRRILSGTSSLTEEAEAATYQASPGDWHVDPEAGMVPTRTAPIPDAPLLKLSGKWASHFLVGRGVEIGASGNLFRCDHCGNHRGPSRQADRCGGCGNSPHWESVQAIATEPRHGGDWVPLIVGRDVRRHQVQPSRWLRTGLAGVSYKNAEVYAAPKLLVRKTGLGLNAAVDTTGSHTNQVVFHYIPRVAESAFLLDYVAGVLCSRVMLAVHLSRSGETEWRSHPYVTPRVLATLPIVVPKPNTPAWTQAQAISAAVAELRASRPEARPRVELLIDRLVTGLYALDDETCKWLEQVLSGTQALEAFSHLRLAPQSLQAEVA